MDEDAFFKRLPRLHVDKNENRYTTGKAPHKPLLLISLIILERNKKIDLADIRPNIYLRETWESLWRCLDYDRVGSIHLPMYHMKSDGFWKLIPRSGMSLHQPKSLTDLTTMTDRISMDDEVIDALRSIDFSNEVINELLHAGYFSEEEGRNLIDGIKSIMSSFRYEESVVMNFKEPFKLDHSPCESPVLRTFEEECSQHIRSPAFRRTVLEAYDETCSVCSIKLVAQNGVSVNDAAHILPFSRFFNDDIRNGLCLCKNHHWLFDRYLLSFDNKYKVVISKDFEMEHPENVLTKFDGESMLLPVEIKKYPHQSALEWHRKNMRQ